MDRSSTPRVSQLPQARFANSAHAAAAAGGSSGSSSSSLRGGPDASQAVPPSSPAREPSAGLLSWMRNALSLAPPSAAPASGAAHEPAGSSTSSSSSSPRASALEGRGTVPPQVVVEPPRLELDDERRDSGSWENSAPSSATWDHSPRSSFSRSSTYDFHEGSDESDEEETFAPFAPAELPQPKAAPSLVRPTARRDASFIPSSSSDRSLDEGQVLLDGAPAPPAVGNDKTPRMGYSSSGADLSRALSVEEVKSDVRIVCDTSKTTTAPALVLTPPDELSPRGEMSPIAGWVEAEQAQALSGPSGGRPAPLERAASYASTSSSLSVDSNATDTTGDGEALVDALGRPRTPAEMAQERQSREKVVLGTRGASLREAAGGQSARQARRERREQQEVEELTRQENIDEWDESRSKTPKPLTAAAAPDTSEVVRTPQQHSRRAASEATPGTPTTPMVSMPNGAALAAPSPRRGARLSFFGRKGRDASISSLNALGSPSGKGHDQSSSASGSSSPITAEPQSWVATSSPAASDHEDSKAGRPHSAMSGSFWRLGNRRREDSTASSRSTQSRRTANSSTTSSLSRTSSSLAPSEQGSDDAHSQEGSSEKKARPVSMAGSFEAVKTKKRGKSLLLDGPRLQKVRSRNKPSKQRDFSRLFLVQELQLGEGSSPPPSRRPSDAVEASRKSGDGQRGVPNKPPLQHTDSMASISTTSSSNAASSQGHAASTTSSGCAPSSAGPKRRATWAMKFSVDGRYLAVAGQDAVIRVYKVLDSPEARKQEVTSLNARAEALAAGNLFPASGGSENASSTSLPGKTANGSASAPSSVRSKGAVEAPPLPSVPVFSSEPVREFVGHTNDCLDLSWSKNGFLLSASMDKTARLWHLSSPTCLVSFVHGDFVTSACFHPRDDRFFLSGSLDGKLRLWNIPAKRVQCSQEVPGLITACAFTRTGGTACVGTFAGAALFYNTDGLVYQSSIAVRSPTGKNAKGGRKITGIEPLMDDSAAGERVLITSNDSRIRAYNLRDKALSGRFKASKTYTNRTSQIRASVSEDGMYVIAGSEAGSEGGFVHLWDVGQLAGDANGTPSTIKASGDSCCEYFSAASGTITCAVMAPLKTHSYLRTSEDPILLHAEMRNAGRVSSHTTSALSSVSLASALSAALPGTLAPGSSAQPQPGFDARSCRILASVDESAVVRIWRQDSYGALPA